MSTLNEFLKTENPERYDFKEECPVEKEVILRSTDEMEKFFHYKIDSPAKFDTDGSGENNHKHMCKLTREIYRKLFEWKDLDSELRYAGLGCTSNVDFGPDTLNTFMTDSLPKFLAETEILTDFKKDNPRQRYISSNMMYEVVVNHKLSLSQYLPENEWNLWNDTAKVTNSIGNFGLVPKGFNTNRARIAKDYWDLSLQILKHGPWGDAGIFNWYINYFYLWDYVKVVDGNYCVLSLFSKDYAKKIDYYAPSDGILEMKNISKKDIEIWCVNIQRAIKRRGIFMVEMLKMKEDDFRRFKKVFNVNAVYDTMEDVVDGIGNIISDSDWAHNVQEKLKGIS